MQIVTVQMLLDVPGDGDGPACDAINEILREHQRSFKSEADAKLTCLIDYAILDSPGFPFNADPETYEEGDAPFGVCDGDYDTWREEYNGPAALEGWGVFNGSEIQRDDEANVFADDDEAYAFVKRLADAGSVMHRCAIALHDHFAGRG